MTAAVTTITIETDYLVIGAGASGMAFVDELLNRTTDTTFVIADRLSQPGGHWNLAYSFVRLHQGSYFYGVNSEALEIEKGKVDLSSKHEILAYYERVLEKMLRTGRVTFLPQCNYLKDGNIESLVANKKYKVTTRKKVVNAFSSEIEVPSTHTPTFKSSNEANVLPINGLGSLSRAYEEYVIIGNGKTGIDAILYLLEQGVDPSQIRWIISRDVWLHDRGWFAQAKAFDYILTIYQAIVREKDTEQIFQSLYQEGLLLKLNDSIDNPKVFRGAIVSKDELNQIGKLGKEQFIRLGKVINIGVNRIELEHGTIATSPNVLHVDCTACGLNRMKSRPIFVDEKNIILQPIYAFNTVWSAATIAMLEAKEDNNEIRNSMAQPFAHSETPEQFIDDMLLTFKNMVAAKSHMKDLDKMRLNMMVHAPFLSTLWKKPIKFLPLVPAILEMADKC